MARRYSSLFPPPIFSIWHSGLQPRRRLRASATEVVAPAFAGGFLLAVANPKAYLAIAAVFAGTSIVGENSALDAAVKIALLGVMIVIIHMCWLLAGASLSHVLQQSNRLPYRQCLAGSGPGCHYRNHFVGLT